MSGFAALMALSASQTKETQSAVQTALQQRQRNEEIRRKKQEEHERKQREEEAKLRQKRFEDEKKERELEARRLADQQKLELEKARREEEQRNTLLYGPKKTKSASKWPSSNGQSREEVRRRRLPSDDDDGSRPGSPAIALTREEKRQRKLEAEMRRTYHLKRSSSGYSKAGKRLPGGAIDATSAPNSSANDSSQSVKARLAALPNTLTKLNVVKRDTRTIDEILQDRAKAREGAVLDGDDAKEFNDWFSKAKKKDLVKTAAQSTTAAASAGSSGANSPLSSGSRAKPVSATSSVPKSTKPVPPASKASSYPSKSSGDVKPRLTADTKTGSKQLASFSKTSASSHKTQPSKAQSSSTGSRSTAPQKKRPRSPSFSPSPPPPAAKRRAIVPQESQSSLGAEIWKIFGKDRGSYVDRDVFSDDEDMEADATALEQEEMRSYRQAKKEDMLALEEEKRHEEEKRRRKRERERRG
ncbi:hypothetical protein BV22DRAFT_1103260 [Leucogyrophana mollusca]|uniref:Uncharacterized protein n=1 Tax=Leucogyrophana mollusca TaxID=85980 RepID=A0ACB8BQX3_9AGAM|nr:hypothetical protein BV22DRAFT_1103260 [Leucogyrophana mollusca]